MHPALVYHHNCRKRTNAEEITFIICLPKCFFSLYCSLYLPATTRFSMVQLLAILSGSWTGSAEEELAFLQSSCRLPSRLLFRSMLLVKQKVLPVALISQTRLENTIINVFPFLKIYLQGYLRRPGVKLTSSGGTKTS